MSLGTRLTFKTAVLVLAVLVVAGVALWGLGGLSRDLDDALGEYDRLREAYVLLSEIDRARSALRAEPFDPQAVRQPVMRAQLALDDRSAGFDADFVASLERDLVEASKQLGLAVQGKPIPDAVLGRLNTAINRLAAEIDDTASRIEAIERRAQADRRRVVLWVWVTAGFAAVLAVLVGAWQYRAVMGPLRRLQRGVDRLTSGDFTQQLDASGDREFASLADDFNRMADDLSMLYRDLDAKVRLRSAQLAQSERLASVGFLAAGVAHEINNPLAIIAGEAELALNDLPNDADPAQRAAIATIRDEAFRCKAITQKLLSLARPGRSVREPVDLHGLAQQVAGLVRSLPQHTGRNIEVVGGSGINADTDASQVKQVLLNLVINALEATEPGAGQVTLGVSHAGAYTVIRVADNGKGLDADALGRVFEPFFSEKNTPSTPGLGLGLSISHAIVEDLGGRLTAASDGPGQGSAFMIELPTNTGGKTH